MELRIEKCTMLIMKKKEKRNNGSNRTAKFRKASGHLKVKKTANSLKYLKQIL